MKRGHFISFEGVDGSGKSTQIVKLKEYLQGKGYDVIITREPGGTEISEKIREVILDPDNNEMTPMTEAFLYAAARAQLVRQVIKPALEEGKIVICDRFVDSSIAYQGYARNLGESVSVINHYAVDGCMPELTVFMKVKPSVGADRIESREKDRIEKEKADFHNAVYRGYEELEKKFPERIAAVDASGEIDDIFREIKRHADLLLKRDGRD